jgi:hypothetical protein
LFAALYTVAAVAGAQPERAEREGQILRAPDLSRESVSAGASAAASASGGSTAEPSAMFRRADRNNDGYLDQRELWGTTVPRGGGWMAMDRDSDGRIAPAEFRSIDPAAGAR